MEEGMEERLVDRALEYAARGWKVFPLHTMRGATCSCGTADCSSATTHPHMKGWLKSCSCDSGEIRSWWGTWPNAPIGLATGSSSGFFVLDIDFCHGGKESMQELERSFGTLPSTLASYTGDSHYHLFFNMTEIEIRSRTNLLPGLNVRGDSDFIIAPTSFHKSGYPWLRGFDDFFISDPPYWLLRFLERGCAGNRIDETHETRRSKALEKNQYHLEHVIRRLVSLRFSSAIIDSD